MAKKIKTRTPAVKDRDPQMDLPKKKIERAPRSYVEAAMPTTCPKCKHGTRMADGRHIDPVKRTILEYRTCSKCGHKIAAGRMMVEWEVEKYCSHAAAVAEYQGG